MGRLSYILGQDKGIGGMFLSIVYFPKPKKVSTGHNGKIPLGDSGKRAPINHDYIKEVMEKHGYTPSKDPLIQAMHEVLRRF
jgi:hypothetical protein